MSEKGKLFFELLQVAIGCRSRLSAIPTNEGWSSMFDIAVKQSLVGILFTGVERLPKEQWPEKQMVLQWMALTSQIEQRNVQTTEVCQELIKKFEADGFKTCILKGQANYAYYPKELKNRRTCGDIDIWVKPIDAECKQPVKSVLEFLEEKELIESLCYLHAEIKPVNGVPVEVHFRPSFMNEPRHNSRFLNLFSNFDRCILQKDNNGVKLPALKAKYDIIFQLCHLYRHLIDEGVGLRQVLDYYYLLKSEECRVKSEVDDGVASLAEESSTAIQHTLKHLGLLRFASALMWVMQEVFDLPETSMICKTSEKEGKFLLEEIMLAGNFGQGDSRMVQLQFKKGNTSFQVKRALRRIRRNFRFIQYYPSEVIWEPIARIEHLVWRKYHLWNH